MTNVRFVSSSLMAAAFCLGLPTNALAAEKPFIGLDYSQRTYENTSNNVSDTEIPAVRLRAGSVVAPYLAVEVHVAVGAGDDTGTIGGTTPYTLKSPLTYGVFVRPQLPLGPVTVYGLAGYSYVQLKYSTATVTGTPTDSIDDVSFGGGLQVNFGKHWGANVDYIQYVEGVSAISGGLLYSF